MSFADIGKKSKDLQSKEFLDLKDDKYARSAFEIRTKSLAGTGFTFLANRKTAAADYDASLAIKKSCKTTGIDHEFTFTPTNVKFTGSQKDKIAEGVKAAVTVESTIQSKAVGEATVAPKVGGDVSVDYTASGNVVNVKVGKAQKDAKYFLELSAAHTVDRNLLGVNVKLAPLEPQLFTEATLAAEHQAVDANVSISGTYKKADESFSANVSVFHQYSAASQFGASVLIPVRGAGAASLTAAVAHKLADDESVRARVQFGGEFTRHAGFAYSTRLGAHTTVTASTDADLTELLNKGLTNDAIKFGFKVSLNAE